MADDAPSKRRRESDSDLSGLSVDDLQVLLEALSRDPEERAGVLAAHCADEHKRERLRRLLDAGISSASPARLARAEKRRDRATLSVARGRIGRDGLQRLSGPAPRAVRPGDLDALVARYPEHESELWRLADEMSALGRPVGRARTSAPRLEFARTERVVRPVDGRRARHRSRRAAAESRRSAADARDRARPGSASSGSARQRSLKREVAVKFLRPGSDSDEGPLGVHARGSTRSAPSASRDRPGVLRREHERTVVLRHGVRRRSDARSRDRRPPRSSRNRATGRACRGCRSRS